MELDAGSSFDPNQARGAHSGGSQWGLTVGAPTAKLAVGLTVGAPTASGVALIANARSGYNRVLEYLSRYGIR